MWKLADTVMKGKGDLNIEEKQWKPFSEEEMTRIAKRRCCSLL
jgi:hypothetical protein